MESREVAGVHHHPSHGEMASLYPESQEAKDLSAYNPEFAHKVLEVAAKNFPRQTSMVELKHALTPEPSNEELFTAIDALEADGYIEAKAMRVTPTTKYRMCPTSGLLGLVERSLRINQRPGKQRVGPPYTAR